MQGSEEPGRIDGGLLSTMRRDPTPSAYGRLAGALLTVWVLAVPAWAQSSQQGIEQPGNNIPNPNQSAPYGPFSHEWSKPGGTTGSYIYNDPRLRSPYRTHPKRGTTRCPAPLIFDPRSGACR